MPYRALISSEGSKEEAEVMEEGSPREPKEESSDREDPPPLTVG